MKKRDKIKNLENSVKEKKLQLEKLERHVDKSSVCSDLYNKVVLEKAILNKKLQDLQDDNFLAKAKQLIPRKKTLICDYFRK